MQIGWDGEEKARGRTAEKFPVLGPEKFSYTSRGIERERRAEKSFSEAKSDYDIEMRNKTKIKEIVEARKRHSNAAQLRNMT